MGEGPQRHLVHVVDEAVAIGADQREFARRLNEPGFRRRPFGPCLTEARRVADNASSPHGIELFQGLDRRVLGNGEEYRVRRFRQIIDRCEAGVAADVAALRVHRPEWPGKADALALGRNCFRVTPANHRNMTRLQQAVEIGAALRSHAPSGRRMAREMMWRWISDVPSQIRSRRASRHRRWMGSSSIRPMPP